MRFLAHRCLASVAALANFLRGHTRSIALYPATTPNSPQSTRTFFCKQCSEHARLFVYFVRPSLHRPSLHRRGAAEQWLMPLRACNRLDWFRATCNYIRVAVDPFGGDRSQRIASLSCSANARKFCALSVPLHKFFSLLKKFSAVTVLATERFERESKIRALIDFNLWKSLKILKNHRIRLF